MPGRANQDEWVMVESSDKTRSTGEGNGKALQHSCLENPMNSMKRQNDRMTEPDAKILVFLVFSSGFPDSSVGKESACNAEDTVLIPGLGRSAGEGLG